MSPLARARLATAWPKPAQARIGVCWRILRQADTDQQPLARTSETTLSGASSVIRPRRYSPIVRAWRRDRAPRSPEYRRRPRRWIGDCRKGVAVRELQIGGILAPKRGSDLVAERDRGKRTVAATQSLPMQSTSAARRRFGRRNICPVRPKPVIHSSKMSSTLWRSQICGAGQELGWRGGDPPVLLIGSTITAATLSGPSSSIVCSIWSTQVTPHVGYCSPNGQA